MRWNLKYGYLNLPGELFHEQPATPVAEPRLAVFNTGLADELGLGGWEGDDLAILAGNAVPPGGRPFAQAYAGHQYAHFTILGDGRALVLGEHQSPQGLVDLQLKGSGPTPYSRSGDGRAALGPMLREFLISEAMAGLGIPTTRSLAVVATGEPVWRPSALPGAILTRVAASHLRVGTFEYAAATGDAAVLQALTDYAIDRHYPQARVVEHPAAAFLEAVIEAQADLVARWMSVGFVHGVMNTDNVAISGQTIDYGPCAFLDTYRAGQVYSSIDQRGRYAYLNQPAITRWNLARLAETLVPLLHPDAEAAVQTAQALIDGFAPRYRFHRERWMGSKLGLAPGDGVLESVEGLLEAMETAGADFTHTFLSLGDALEGRGPVVETPELAGWHREWLAMIDRRGTRAEAQARMRAANPAVIPRNHRVEEALDAATEGDLGPFHRLWVAARRPYELQAGDEDLALPPDSETSEAYVTFCGT